MPYLLCCVYGVGVTLVHLKTPAAAMSFLPLYLCEHSEEWWVDPPKHMADSISKLLSCTPRLSQLATLSILNQQAHQLVWHLHIVQPHKKTSCLACMKGNGCHCECIAGAACYVILQLRRLIHAATPSTPAHCFSTSSTAGLLGKTAQAEDNNPVSPRCHVSTTHFSCSGMLQQESSTHSGLVHCQRHAKWMSY